MTAGGSAERRADDLLEKAARPRAAAEQAERDAHRWQQGRAGEERVAQVLDGLAPHGVRAVHDRSAPDSDANLDHVVVAPTGIFVIDAKNWAGTLAVRDGHLWQSGRRRDEIIDSAIAQHAAISRLVESLGPPHPLPVRAVVCFAGSAQLGRRERLAHVELIDLRHLPTLMTHGDQHLSPVEVEYIGEQVRTRLSPRTGYTEAESKALPMQPPPEPVVFLTRWTKHGQDHFYVMDENGERGGHLDLATGDVVAESDSAEPILRRLLAMHLATATKDETTEETRSVINAFLRQRTAEEAQRIQPALVVGKTWQNFGKRRLYVHWLGPRGETTDLGWFDLKDRRVQQAPPGLDPIVRYCGERYLACRTASAG
jgi:hypothetical protein